MNKYNPNFRWFLASNFNQTQSTYESRPFIALGYNNTIDKDDTPDFNRFDYTNALFVPLDSIKIVRNSFFPEIPDYTINDRDYKKIANISNYDSFDDIVQNIDATDPEIFYYLYLSKVANIKNSLLTKINQMSIILVYTYASSPYKYDDFSDQLNVQLLTSAYEVVPLSLAYFSDIEVDDITDKFEKFDVIL